MLVYGKEARLPVSTEFPALDLANQLILFEEGDPLQQRYTQLLQLEEEREKSYRTMEYRQL